MDDDYVHDDSIYVPMDPELGIYESTDDLESRLVDRHFERKEQQPPEPISLGDVEGEMDELKTDKDADDTVRLEMRKEMDELVKNTVIYAEKKKLDAVRICQIERRLKLDPTLRMEEDGGDGAKTIIEIPENAASEVKRSLIRKYNKIKRAQYDMSPVAIHQLEEKIVILRKL
uniref:Uncharacterized protein n=1 Tax=Noctiluca scintillans TaxID=2966 RepID=A0A7S1FG59_NOCSC|mmetsp:Transcript_5861/g.16558  ORF Transcript_5861/g.16558 Transcript_5861/m.16558 type:complete len:173 (+) Transcript_5861:59-577(+)